MAIPAIHRKSLTLWCKMEFLFADAFFALTGWCLLFAGYRSRKKVRAVLQEQFDGSFAQAGRLLSYLAFVWILLIGIIAMLLAIVYIVLHEPVQQH